MYIPLAPISLPKGRSRIEGTLFLKKQTRKPKSLVLIGIEIKQRVVAIEARKQSLFLEKVEPDKLTLAAKQQSIAKVSNLTAAYAERRSRRD